MEAWLLPILAVSICFRLAVVICVGMSLVVLKPIDVLILLVAVGVGTVDEHWRGAALVQEGGLGLPLGCGGRASGVGAHALPGLAVLRARVEVQLHGGLVLPLGGSRRAGLDVLGGTVWGRPSAACVEATPPPFAIGTPSVLARQPPGLSEAGLGAGCRCCGPRSLPSAPAPSHLQVTGR